MQLSDALQRRAPLPGFANHTPRHWEITSVADHPSQSHCPPDMFGPGPGITIGAGPLYTNAIMGQAPSALEREKIRKASSTILREDSIQQFEESRCPSPITEREQQFIDQQTLPLSRPDSWSMHYDCTNERPYANPHTVAGASSNHTLSGITEDKMMTQSSLSRLPRDNPSHDLAFFLRTTGPTAPHRKPSKIEHPRRAVSGKNALRFLGVRGGQKRHVSQVQTAHERLNGVLHFRDEGGLLSDVPDQPIPEGYEQKISSTGKRYLALIPKTTARDQDIHMTDGPSILSPEVLESRVSVSFADDITSFTGDVPDSWLSTLHRQQTHKEEQCVEGAKKPASSYQEVAKRLERHHPTPIRPAASEPPSPIPESAISMSESYRGSSIFDNPPPKLSFDASRALTSHPIREDDPQTPKLSLPNEEFPVKHPSPEKEVEIKHPLPRRLGSHPVLLQRASSIASTMYQRSVSDSLGQDFSESPGPPPPRSPLRLRRDPRTIENIIATHEHTRKSTPRMAPSIKSQSDFNFDSEPVRATVTTECTGPIKRPKSRNRDKKGTLPRVPYPTNRKEREERARARKARERPSINVNRTIDSVVNEPPPANTAAQSARQRLKKMRPHISIPDLKPAPLRHSSSASATSSAPSWRKHTTVTRISPVPSRASEEHDDMVEYTPISPTASGEARAAQAGLGMSPMMLVAEEVPIPKTTKSPKPPKLVIKEPKGKSYAPRPRSASLPRNAAAKRRSRQSITNSRTSISGHSSPRAKSPALLPLRHSADEIAPPLPSPPPNRALPPTPPQSGSEKPNSNTGLKRIQSKDLPTLPSHEVSPLSTSSTKKPNSNHHQHLPHIATQRKTSGENRSKAAGTTSKASNRAASRIDARLEALEKQNALLSAALMAVLRTNGSLNGPPLPTNLASLLSADIPPESPKGGGPMAWETRVARRSAATTGTATSGTSHAPSSSEGSALEMYMSTRRGSRRFDAEGGSRM